MMTANRSVRENDRFLEELRLEPGRVSSAVGAIIRSHGADAVFVSVALHYSLSEFKLYAPKM